MLSNEQTQILEQAIFLLIKLRNDQSIEHWERERGREFKKVFKGEHEREFQKQLNGIYDGVRESNLKKSLLQEVKQMLIELHIKGSVRERANGLIEFRNADFGSVYGRTVEELGAKLLEKIKQLKANKSKNGITLSEFFCESYLPFKKESLAQNSIEGIKTDFNFLIESGFDKPLNRYTAENIEKFLLSIPKTRKRQKVRGLLNNIFTYAKQLGKIKVNPCDNVPKVKHTKKVGRALSFKTQEMFFENIFICEKLTLAQKLFLAYLYLTGSRRAEALNVRASDFDLIENTLHIPGTKTGGSDRIIPLTPILKKLYFCMSAVRNVNEGTFFDLKQSQVDRIMHYGAEGHHLHELRHTFGTIAVCVQKLDPKTVSLYMGHSEITMTLNTYTHPEQLDKGLFYDGSKAENEKIELMRAEYAAILSKISEFIKANTQNIPKN